MRKSKKHFAWFIAIILFVFGIALTSFVPLLKSINLGLDLQGGFEILYEIKPLDGKGEVTSDMVQQTYKTLLRRVDVLGVSEPKIEIEGKDRIRVQLAGIDNPEEARNLLSKVANLSFRNSDDELLMHADVLRAGSAKLASDQYGKPAVALGIKDSNKFYDVTKKVSESSDQMMVIWLDFEDGVDSYDKEKDKPEKESKIISAARVGQAFSSDVQITGNFSKEEAKQLAELINSGSLPTKLTEAYETNVGAKLGEDALAKTMLAGIVGAAFIYLFMISIYKFAGFISTITLTIYSFLIFLVFWLIGGTLTLPGIAAMVIGLGMAVDANIITFERIREEMLKGRNVQTAFKDGNSRSFWTIFDANITTLLVAVLLYIFGQSSVKGFAVMLIISIAVTFLITVFVTRLLLWLVIKSGYALNNPYFFIGIKQKDIPNLNKNEQQKIIPFQNIDFVKHRKKFYIGSSTLIIIGIIFIVITGFNLGIDFTSGSNVTISSETALTKDEVNNQFKELGYDIKELTFLSENKAVVVRLDKVLEKDEVNKINAYFKEKSGKEPNISTVSPMVGKELTKNAFTSMLLASIGILIYVKLRFKMSYAIGGIVALMHDALIILGMFSILRFEVNGVFIAAILSILGYSINDSIIAFDRIRENINTLYNGKIDKIEQLDHVCNISLQQTFKRSIYTTVTVIIPVIALLLLGSYEVFYFNMALFIGLIAGAYSSIFIAAQIWLSIERRNFTKPKTERKKWINLEDEPQEIEIKGINS